MKDLSERKQRILRAVVTDYIHTAEPVGSRTISRRYHMDLSAATIRNEMADLEELGYLTQPHTSAGRIPSQRGYRFYVDCLMDMVELTTAEENYLARVFLQLEKMREIDQIVQHTVKVLAQMTNYVSLVLGAQFKRSVFKQLRIIPLDAERALVVLLTDSGYVRSKALELPKALNSEELARIVKYLNEQLAGQTIEELTLLRLQGLCRSLYAKIDLVDQLLLLLEEMSREDSTRVFLGGTANILKQPEFRDVEKFGHLLELFEQDEALGILLEPLQGGLSVRIGTENPLQEVSECSLVTASYMLYDRPLGTLGVLGPTRMDYGKVVVIMQRIMEKINALVKGL
ncbi:MAG: Heat-inducible transcription repressor HrcA [Syntrophomonadaceae bacterium]|nr:Heat-inducible transcription repressor HrcA [Bacillota bacterium]